MKSKSGQPRIAVVGSGFAGVKCATSLAMGLTGGKSEIDLISPDDMMTLKPRFNSPMALQRMTRLPLARLVELYPAIRHRRNIVESVDFPTVELRLADGNHARYDFLILATGAEMAPANIPGLTEHIFPYWRRQPEHAWAARLERAFGQHRNGATVLFVIAPGNFCPDPVYNMVAETDAWLKARGQRNLARLLLATHEPYAGALFGDRNAYIAADAIIPCLDRLECGYRLARIATGASCPAADDDFGNRLEFTLLFAAPPQRPALPTPTLYSDRHGFPIVQRETAQLPGYPNIYIVGDQASGVPKQAYHAVRQAEIAAADIVSRILGKSRTRLTFAERDLAAELGETGRFPNRSQWWN